MTQPQNQTVYQNTQHTLLLGGEPHSGSGYFHDLGSKYCLDVSHVPPAETRWGGAEMSVFPQHM